MAPHDTHKPEEDRPHLEVSRRHVLAGAAALAGAGMIPSVAKAAEAELARRQIFAYVGAYTPNSTGISLFQQNPHTGALSLVKTFDGIASPSWLALDAAGRHLYAVNETANFNGGSNGSVTSFAVNRANGDLTPLGVVDSQGGAPVYVNIHPSGKWAFVANYMGGNVAAFPILADGSLGAASSVQADVGPLGPTKPVDAPPGSFANSGHDAPHAHIIHSDPSGRFVLSNDLGQDRTFIWRFDQASGTLLPNPASVSASPGSGPRHFVFHPNGRYFYNITEEASTIEAYRYDGHAGALTPLQTLSALPAGFVGTSYGSEILISGDGRFLYAVNRLHDSIGVFGIDAGGGLTHIAHTQTHGDYPRSIRIDPTGNFLYACNQHSDAITIFRVDRGLGTLSFTDQYVPVGSPAVITFLA